MDEYHKQILKNYPKNSLVPMLIQTESDKLIPKQDMIHFHNIGFIGGLFKVSDLIKYEDEITFSAFNDRVSVNPVEHVLAAEGSHEGNWGVNYLKAKKIWETTTGKDIVVAVLDSGIDSKHPYLRHAVLKQFVKVDDKGEYTIYNSNSLENDDQDGPSDSGEHGTHVASIIAGQSNELDLGIAPGAKLLSIQVLDGKDGTVSRLIGGLRSVLEFPDVKIVNLSVEIPGMNSALAHAIYDVVKSGRIVVAASGNSGPGRQASPGNYPEELVISVGAISTSENVWSYSNGGEFTWSNFPISAMPLKVLVPRISAPGKRIIGALAKGNIKMISGTSQATPHVTAACALFLELYPEATVEEVRDRLFLTAKDAGNSGWDMRFGNGILDLEKFILFS